MRDKIVPGRAKGALRGCRRADVPCYLQVVSVSHTSCHPARKESQMRDVLYVAIVIAFFALCAAYVGACGRIVGRDPVVEPDDPDNHTGTGPSLTEVR